MKKKAAILGYHDGTACQVETWFEEATGCKLDCFVVETDEPLTVDIAAENQKRASQRTSYPENGFLKKRPIITSHDWLRELRSRDIHTVLPLTPDNRIRQKQIQQLLANGFELVSAIHPTVTILPESIIEPGVWINAGCIIGYKAEISSGAIINTGAQIDHHCILKSCCQLDPAVVTAGNVAVGECSHIHTNATIINRITIGDDAVVGAGAVVIRDVPSRTTVVGVPANRVLQRRLL